MLFSGSSFTASSAWISWLVLIPEARPVIWSWPPAPVLVSVELEVRPPELLIVLGVMIPELELVEPETLELDIALS
jgi:hypothetical protein